MLFYFFLSIESETSILNVANGNDVHIIRKSYHESRILTVIVVLEYVFSSHRGAVSGCFSLIIVFVRSISITVSTLSLNCFTEEPLASITDTNLIG